MSGVRPVFQNLNYNLQRRLSDVPSDTLGREFDPGKRDFSH